MFERLLQFNLAALSVLGTCFIGFAQQNQGYEQGLLAPLWMLIAAFASLAFTDWIKWFRLTRPIANLAAVMVVGVTIWRFWDNTSDNQLIAIADLLTYLQIVLLFQEKNERLYWQLATLSLLQVVVSAAMNLGGAFGVLLVLYVIFGFTALTLFLVVRETQGFETAPAKLKPSNGRAAPLTIATSGSANSAAAWGETAAWKRALGDAPRLRFQPGPRSLARELLMSGLPRQIALLLTATALFAITMFFVSPRVGGASWQGARFGARAKVGFAPNVSLKDMGDILQDDTVALHVAFTHMKTGTPYWLHEEPYLRGATLVRYARNGPPGTWEPLPRGFESPFPEPSATAELVRQDVRLEATGDPSIFSVFPAHRLPESPQQIRLDRRGERAFRLDAAMQSGKGYRYALGTTGLRAGGIAPILPEYRGFTGPRGEERLRELMQFDPERFPQLIELANQILRDANAIEQSSLRKAKVLESHFVNSGRYEYSLRSRGSRDPNLDPIEHFVSERRAGHCEHFASALAIMLRSQGIPARLVVGYHGGEYNTVGNYWVVRQRHAHAWVEAFVAPEDIAQNSNETELLPFGGWLRLDPTPGATNNNLLTQQLESGWFDRIGEMLGYGEFLWREYVMELNGPRQQTSIYQPLTNQARTTLGDLLTIETWRGWWRGESAWSFQNWSVRDWFSWRAAVLAMGTATFLVAAYSLGKQLINEFTPARQLFRRLRRMVGRIPETEVARVGFFARWEELLARRGWRRTPFQTPREFVTTLREQSTEFREHPTWPTAASSLVAFYYRLRFGTQPLTETETAALERHLGEFEPREELGSK